MLKVFYITSIAVFSAVSFMWGQRADTTTNDYTQNKYLDFEKSRNLKRMGSETRKEFELSPDALNEYLYFRNNTKAGFVLSAIGSGLMMSSIFASTRNNNLTAGLFSGGCLTLGSSIAFSMSAKKHFRKAIRYRNNDAFVKR